MVAVAYGDDRVFIVGCSILMCGKLCKSVHYGMYARYILILLHLMFFF